MSGAPTVRLPVLLCLIACAAGDSAGQDSPLVPPPIRDNSFFVEEGYNQEAGVVQHVITLHAAGETVAGLTGEYPLGGEDHQLSITIPVRTGEPPGRVGIGDVVVGYRYRLLGPEGGIAVASRVSVALPTRSGGPGLGPAEPGVEVNLPASVDLARPLVLHANLGGALLRMSGDDGGSPGWVTSLQGAVSCVVLLHDRLNLMCEGVVRLPGGRREDGSVRHTAEFLLSPGIRGAVDIGAVQIVPGVALPVRFAGSERQAGLFAYLSVEHPL